MVIYDHLGLECKQIVPMSNHGIAINSQHLIVILDVISNGKYVRASGRGRPSN